MIEYHPETGDELTAYESTQCAYDKIDAVVAFVVQTLEARGYECRVRPAETTYSHYIIAEKAIVDADDYIVDTIDATIRVSDHPPRRDCSAEIYLRGDSTERFIREKLAHLT